MTIQKWCWVITLPNLHLESPSMFDSLCHTGETNKTCCTSQTTQAISPELKECATRPQSPPFCLGNTAKTENSILELSLLLASKKYDHMYRFKHKKRSKNKCTWCWRGQVQGSWSKEVKAGAKENMDSCTLHNKSMTTSESRQKRKGGV